MITNTAKLLKLETWSFQSHYLDSLSDGQRQLWAQLPEDVQYCIRRCLTCTVAERPSASLLMSDPVVVSAREAFERGAENQRLRTLVMNLEVTVTFIH